jgi:hypothetical protein
MKLAADGTRPHPGGGSETKWSEGDTSPTRYYNNNELEKFININPPIPENHRITSTVLIDIKAKGDIYYKPDI